MKRVEGKKSSTQPAHIKVSTEIKAGPARSG